MNRLEAMRIAALDRLRWTRRYLVDLGKWFWTPPASLVFFALGFVGIAWLLSYPCLERQIRISGMVLQLLGVLAAGIGLRDTRRAFDNQPTTWVSIKEWWLGRPRFGPKTYILHAERGSLALSGGTARGRMHPGPDASLDQRVALLEQQSALLYDEVGNLAAETKQKTDQLSCELKAESEERRSADEENQNRLRRAIAEGLPLGRVGVIFFMIGITSGTASAEIALLFGRGSCQ